MKIGFFQFAPFRLQFEANLAMVQEAVSPVDFDLLVLPELFTSGYLFQNRQELIDFATNHPFHETIDQLCHFLKTNDKGGYLAGTLPKWCGGKVYNTGFVLHADGLTGVQRKRHLPRLEKRLFTAGDDVHSIDTASARVGIATCFDAWFPEFFRLLSQEGAQIILQPANFGGPQTLDIMRVRAMENRCFVVVANRTGNETVNGIDAAFRGESRIIGPDGQVLLSAGPEPALQLISIDPALADDKSNIICDDLSAEWSRYSVHSKP